MVKNNVFYAVDEKLKDFCASQLQDITEERDFVRHVRSFIDAPKKMSALIVSGLRSTGKTAGILQALSGKDAVYISATKKAGAKSQDIVDYLHQCNKKIIAIDEYSWIEDPEGELSSYLASQLFEDKRIVITGTDSAKILALRNTDLIHRAVTVSTNSFSYEEYLRIHHRVPSAFSMQDFLTEGGLFQIKLGGDFQTIQDYIKTAILDNLSSYYTSLNPEQVRAAVYTVFYECICNSYGMNERMVPSYRHKAISYDAYLDLFGIDPGLIIDTNVLHTVMHGLQNIGVVVCVNDLRIQSHFRSYITNQSLSAQLTKCIFELEELDGMHLGRLYEAAVVCHVYKTRIGDDPNPDFKLAFLHGRTGSKDYEIDFILYDDRSAYLFECKMNDNDHMVLPDSASIVKDIIPNLLGDRDILGRFVIYQGKDKVLTANGMELYCTNNWDVPFERFQRLIEEHREHPYEEDRE